MRQYKDHIHLNRVGPRGVLYQGSGITCCPCFNCVCWCNPRHRQTTAHLELLTLISSQYHLWTTNWMYLSFPTRGMCGKKSVDVFSAASVFAVCYSHPILLSIPAYLWRYNDTDVAFISTHVTCSSFNIVVHPRQTVPKWHKSLIGVKLTAVIGLLCFAGNIHVDLASKSLILRAPYVILMNYMYMWKGRTNLANDCLYLTQYWANHHLHNWFRHWLATWLAPDHYLNQCCLSQ